MLRVWRRRATSVIRLAGRWRRHRYVAPRRLIVTADSAIAADAALQALKHLKFRPRWRLFQVIHFRSLLPDRRDQLHPRIGGIWEASVRRGTEAAVAFELECHIALTLERVIGYSGVDAGLSLAAARSAVAVHPARLVRPSADGLGTEFLALGAGHQRSMELICDPGATPTRPVHVALMDTGLEPDHLDPAIRNRVSVRSVEAEFSAEVHGAVSATIIAAVASTATVTVWAASRENGTEIELTESIYAAADSIRLVDVVVIPLSMNGRGYVQSERSTRSAFERAVAGLAEHTVVIAAAGNADRVLPWRGPDLKARFPATASTVAMIGSVDPVTLSRSPESCFELGDHHPGLYVCAPGEIEFTARGGQVAAAAGTSVAAAYAGGVVARSLGCTPDRPRTSVVLAQIAEGAQRDFAGYVDVEHGAGIVRQVGLHL